MKTHADQIMFGHGKVDGSITAMFLSGGEKLYPVALSTQGKLYLNFGYCKRAAFADPSKRQDWLSRLNQVPGIHLPSDSIDKFPGVHLADLSSGDRVTKFLQVMDWFVGELSSTITG
jgi:hypothetical protein